MLIILSFHVMSQRTLWVPWDEDCLILCSYTVISVMNLLGASGKNDMRGRWTNSYHYHRKRSGAFIT